MTLTVHKFDGITRQFREELKEMLDKRWRDQEHLLICHPKYMETFSLNSKKSSKLDLLHMSQYAILSHKNLSEMILVIWFVTRNCHSIKNCQF